MQAPSWFCRQEKRITNIGDPQRSRSRVTTKSAYVTSALTAARRLALRQVLVGHSLPGIFGNNGYLGIHKQSRDQESAGNGGSTWLMSFTPCVEHGCPGLHYVQSVFSGTFWPLQDQGYRTKPLGGDQQNVHAAFLQRGSSFGRGGGAVPEIYNTRPNQCKHVHIQPAYADHQPADCSCDGIFQEGSLTWWCDGTGM